MPQIWLSICLGVVTMIFSNFKSLVAKRIIYFVSEFLNFLVILCYKVMQVFMVTGLFAGQHNTKLHGTITGVITIVGSALLRD